MPHPVPALPGAAGCSSDTTLMRPTPGLRSTLVRAGRAPEWRLAGPAARQRSQAPSRGPAPGPPPGVPERRPRSAPGALARRRTGDVRKISGPTPSSVESRTTRRRWQVGVRPPGGRPSVVSRRAPNRTGSRVETAPAVRRRLAVRLDPAVWSERVRLRRRSTSRRGSGLRSGVCIPDRHASSPAVPDTACVVPSPLLSPT